MSWYTRHQFTFLCLDPVHVGAGGYRLGRVDNAIVREPGTNVPKIPGTSLSGASRSYAAMLCGRQDAAGQHKDVKEKDAKKCPILYTFGTAVDRESQGQSKAGAVSFSDAQILFFPVSSATHGPLWVTTEERLRSNGIPWTGPKPDDNGKAVLLRPNPPQRINAGWLLLEAASENGSITLPGGHSAWKDLNNRVLLMTERYFQIIVNSNLEVRTSVSINPKTGAAEEGLLFTYEAIPRGTWLTSDVVVDDYGNGFPKASEEKWTTENPAAKKWEKPIDVASSGLRLIEYLGVGGMGTRGFGRMAVIQATEKKDS